MSFSIEPSQDVPPLKILIVDDFEPDIRFMQRMLNTTLVKLILPPFIIRSVNSIGKALTMHRSYRPDCILLDYNLPDMTGLDLVETILSSEGKLDAAIVMMTGAGDENIAVQAMKLGVSDYLVKGQVTEDQLGWTIHSALERIRLQKELDDKHEELEMFASRAAHDMVSPLTNLSLYVECLQEQQEKQLGDYVEDGVDTFDAILSIVDHMTGLIDGLSTYAQVGRSNMPFDIVDLAELHRYILLVSESEIADAGATINLGKLPTIYGDRVGLSQFFQNLIANAIKYRGEDPPVIDIDSEEDGDSFHIWVRDNGIGIDPMYHSEIFSPFKRLHNRTEYKGCGLGLATCKKVIQQHKGHIWVESTLGRGTTIHITLPRSPHRRPGHSLEWREEAADANSGHRVRFVDADRHEERAASLELLADVDVGGLQRWLE